MITLSHSALSERSFPASNLLEQETRSHSQRNAINEMGQAARVKKQMSVSGAFTIEIPHVTRV